MPSDLLHVIKLLDDPDASVQEAVRGYFQGYGGDISEQIAGDAISLSHKERRLLSQYLIPGRQRNLANQWLIPSAFHKEGCQDWDTFEFLLSLLSDYLHDGLTLRPSLADSLDQLADEVHLAEASTSIEKLGRFLFSSERFMGNTARYFAKENSDLVWVIHHTLGNPISLVTIFMLIANRFGLEVEGCNYPGHFLAWVPSADRPFLMDAYNRGRILHPDQIIKNNPNLSENARISIAAPCSLKSIILRMLNNIETSFIKEDQMSEPPFILRLKKSLQAEPVV